MDSREFNRLGRRLALLTLSNPKIEKSLASGWLTAGLHLAPAWVSGHNTCANHTAECAAGCLFWAGRGGMSKVQQARIARTKMFFTARKNFLDLLADDITLVDLVGRRFGLKPAVRLNLTSDIRWETHGIVKAFPDIMFYDYTKLENRKGLPVNYHLTFSYSGDNLDACRVAVANGMNIAVPFLKMPDQWLGLPVVDGDADDLRFLTQRPCVVGLKAKGRLRKTPTSAFLGDNVCPAESLFMASTLCSVTTDHMPSMTMLGGPTNI